MSRFRFRFRLKDGERLKDRKTKYLSRLTVGNSGGVYGLVDDSHDVESGDDSGVLGGLTLGVVEVGGDGHDCVCHLEQ